MEQIQFPTLREMDEKLKNKKEKAETERKRILAKFKRDIVIWESVVLIVSLLICFLFQVPFLQASIWIIIALVVVYAIIHGRAHSEYQNFFKDIIYIIMDELVQSGNQQMGIKEKMNVEYIRENGMEQTEFQNSEIIDYVITHDHKFQSEDTFKSKINNVNFTFSEVELKKEEEYRDSDGKKRTRVTMLFRGIFFKAAFNKTFEGVTRLKDKKPFKKIGKGGKIQNLVSKFATIITVGMFSMLLLNFIRIMFTSFKDGHLDMSVLIMFLPHLLVFLIPIIVVFIVSKFGKYKKVEMENEEFNSQFNVTSTSQIESRYILTTGVMERFLNLRNKLQKPINATFKNNMLYLGISYNENLFEGDIFKEITSEEIEDDYEVLKQLLEIILELDLTTRIWDVK